MIFQNHIPWRNGIFYFSEIFSALKCNIPEVFQKNIPWEEHSDMSTNGIFFRNIYNIPMEYFGNLYSISISEYSCLMFTREIYQDWTIIYLFYTIMMFLECWNISYRYFQEIFHKYWNVSKSPFSAILPKNFLVNISLKYQEIISHLLEYSRKIFSKHKKSP